MKVLHLSSSYPFTDLYKNLLQELDNKGIEQTMYVSIKDVTLKNKRTIENPKGTNYIFSATFNNLDRYIYYTKIQKIYKDIKNNVDFNQIDLTHTHFLFSDGSIAYKIKKEFGIDYIVAVRNADVNFFFKYGFHIRNYGIKILKEAKKVIFISPTYKERVLQRYIPEKLKAEIDQKSYIVPNGIDKFWLENVNREKNIKLNLKEINLIFVGELNKNKNIINSLKAANLLIKKGYNINFNIIGKGPLEIEIKELIKETKNEKNFKLFGYVKDKEELLKLYRNSDIFIMPSYHETFGLVYIEAMSQGLPVIYSKGQGIDGYFNKGEIGYPVSPDNLLDIVESIEKIIKNYNEMYKKTIDKVYDFDWEKIAERYIGLYREIYEP
ncbi:glycosyltransferase family 4 protein [Oceanobacillus profundus]|uniref:Glycosyltransferase family 4 protein n=1 Tax=Oceanobacillus profundus TaxID=372463 RepID=A0A417YCQ3_9BACI|nr:glycosyltransferase family 4 protein [Oceanobacillus profundus]RHW30395.1 glycosyltransferase family 4 protein [Oceanobacillus profundus]